MKLIDILARDFPEWPARCSEVHQLKDGRLNFCGARMWSESIYDLVEGYPSHVTKSEWEAARAALNKPAIDWDSVPEGYPIWIESKKSKCADDWHKEFNQGYIDRDGLLWYRGNEGSDFIVHRRPETPPAVEWKEGELPPAGTTCQIYVEDHHIQSALIIAIGSQRVLILDNKTGKEWAPRLKCCKFQPIKTEAEKAEEERQAAINEMLKHCNSSGFKICRDSFEYLYDAGFRLDPALAVKK